MSLLETVKPYVMESLRMPALPCLLLFSHTLDCSGDFSVIVCDCWLELRFLSAEHAQDQVYKKQLNLGASTLIYIRCWRQ